MPVTMITDYFHCSVDSRRRGQAGQTVCRQSRWPVPHCPRTARTRSAVVRKSVLALGPLEEEEEAEVEEEVLSRTGQTLAAPLRLQVRACQQPFDDASTNVVLAVLLCAQRLLVLSCFVLCVIAFEGYFPARSGWDK